MNEIILNSDTRDWLQALRIRESERAVPYRDIARWVSTASASGGRDSEVGRTRPENVSRKTKLSVYLLKRLKGMNFYNHLS